MVCLDTVGILEQRVEFLENIRGVAIQCGWLPSEVQELHEYLLAEVIKIDNLMFDIHEETDNPHLAYLVWQGHMEDLRHWLTLILGIKIEFI